MDKYNLTARVYPMILFYLPLIVLIIVPNWNLNEYYHYAIPIIVVSALIYLTSHLGRDAGKQKEQKIWKDWGGAPTTQLFRWADLKIDAHTKARNHAKMQILCPVALNYDAVTERQNPAAADEVYHSWTKFLIIKTRDINQHPLIYKENIAYGFRRNLWGLKHSAIIMLLFLMCFAYLYFVYNLGMWKFQDLPRTFIFSEILLLFILLFWVFKFTKSWVKIAAFAYAERLHESIENL